ncbi:MAG: hypothetical protein COB40_12380 [Marinosulfonomonas sp.]|nr:MAG: hypothetical protein COB40_12380 [Marinosulfonomonas sp.]
MRILRHLTANAETLTPFGFKRELSMQSYLIENEGVLALDDTFCDAEIICEELAVKQARTSRDTDGRIDLLVTYTGEFIGIVELKLGELDNTHLEQLEDYLKTKEKVLEADFGLSAEIKENSKWIGVLAGASISRQLADKISSGYSVDGVPIAALTIQRFRGEGGQVYVATDTYFKNALADKDKSKYDFQGQKYGKGQLVLAVMKHFSGNNVQMSFAEMRQKFPNIGSHEIFVLSEKAFQKIEEDKNGRKRHFVKPDQLIQLADSTIAVSNQWGIGNIDAFIERAKKLEYNIWQL